MSYTVTVPDEQKALRAAAEFFATLCDCVVEPKAIMDVEGMDFETFKARMEKFAPTPIKIITPGVTGNTATCVIVDNVSKDWIEPDIRLDPASIFASRSQDGQTVPRFVPGPDKTLVPDNLSVFGNVTPFNPIQDAIDQSSNNQPPPATVDLDSEGLPWDARIHASSKARVKDQSWRVKKTPGDMTKDQWDAEVARIKAELKQSMSIPSAPAPPSGKINTLVELTDAIMKSGLTSHEVTDVCQEMGLTGLADLGNRPDLIPNVATALGV